MQEFSVQLANKESYFTAVFQVPDILMGLIRVNPEAFKWPNEMKSFIALKYF